VRTYAHDWSFAHDAITQRIVSTISQRKKHHKSSETVQRGKVKMQQSCYLFIFISSKIKITEKIVREKANQETEDEQLLHKLHKRIPSFLVFNSSNEIARNCDEI